MGIALFQFVATSVFFFSGNKTIYVVSIPLPRNNISFPKDSKTGNNNAVGFDYHCGHLEPLHFLPFHFSLFLDFSIYCHFQKRFAVKISIDNDHHSCFLSALDLFCHK